MYGDCSQPSLLGVYVDDIIFAVASGLLKASDAIATMFPSKEIRPLPFTFAGSHVDRACKRFGKHQVEYTGTLLPLDAVSLLEDYWRLRHQLAWLANSRRYIVSAVKIMSQVTAVTFSARDVGIINPVQCRATAGCALGLELPPLDIDTLQLIVYSDM